MAEEVAKIKKQNPRLIVAGNIKKLMTVNGINNAALAARAGMSGSSLSKRLNGQIPFDVDELFRIANYFKADVSILFS